jgi:hypothetical protein
MRIAYYTRIVSGLLFVVTAIMWLNAFMDPTASRYMSAFLWLCIALLSHGMEKVVSYNQSKSVGA